MAFPNAYPTKDDVKAWLRPNSSQALGNNDDTLIQNCVTAAIVFAEGPEGTGRYWEVTADTTRHFDAVRDIRGRELRFDADICQITSVVNGDGQTVPPSAYVTNPRNITPYYSITLKATVGYVWQWVTDPEDAIAVTGRWGFSTAAPPDIAQAVLEIAVFEYRRRVQSGSDDRPVITPSGVTINASALPRTVKEVLWARRRKSL